jgi:glycosyltransferase involved in cell wall biosynthesis
LVTIDNPVALLTFLASGDLFVAPSADETLPLAAIEAQAMGVPVVAARSPDAQIVVSDGKTGTLSKPGNIASLASGITFLLRHPNFRRTYAENGPGWVAKNFDVHAVGSQLDATLHRVVRLVSPNDAARPVRPVD